MPIRLPVLGLCLLLLLPVGPALAGPQVALTPGPAVGHAMPPPAYRTERIASSPPASSLPMPPAGALNPPPAPRALSLPVGALSPSPGCVPSLLNYTVTIRADGSVSNLSAPLLKVGNTYELTGSLSGSLLDEWNGSTLDGKGYSLDGQGSAVALALANVNGSRVTNLTVGGSSALLVVWKSSNVTISTVRELAGPATHVGLCGELSTGLVLTSDILAENPSSGGASDAAATFGGDTGVTITTCSFLGTYDFLASGLVGTNLSGNNFSGPGSAIWLGSVESFSETNDRFSNSTQGLAVVTVMNSRDLSWVGNQFAQPPNLGFLIEFSDNVRIDSNHFTGFAGSAIFIVGGGNQTLSRNQFLLGGNTSIAINLDSVGSVAVDSNTAVNGGTDLWAAYTSPLAIRNNSFQYAGFNAINLSEENHAYVTGNNLQGSASPAPAAGLAVTNCSELELLNNSLGGWSGNGAASLRAFNLQSSRLTGNQLPGSFYGMVLYASYNLFIFQNQIGNGEFVGNGSGLLLFADGNLNVSGNGFLYDHFGIHAQYGGDSVFDENNFSFANGIGVVWNSFFNVSFEHNAFLYDVFGLDLKGGADFVLSSNDGSDPSQTCGQCNVIYLQNDAHGVIDSNNLSYTNVGLGGSFVGNLSIDGNTGYGTGFLALLGESYNLSFARNVGSSGLEGIEVDGGTNIKLEGNQYSSAVVGGFRLAGITRGFVDGNLASGGSAGAYGLEVSGSTAVTLSNNTLSNVSVGLEVDNSTGISVLGNTLGGDNASFALLSDSGLLFDHNNFEQDRGYTISGSGGLRFNASYPVGGNFWSNYTSPDVRSGPLQQAPGADNIVDRPFLARGGVSDAFPLVTPWAFPVVEFVPHGLPPTLNWSVSASFRGAGTGTSDLSGRSSVLSLPVPFAATVPFDFTVAPVPGFVPSPRTGAGNTTPRVLLVTINFAGFLAPVEFHERGLAPGTSWSISAGGPPHSSTSDWVNLTLVNGSYAYSVSPVGGYGAIPPGRLDVGGTTLLVPVNFSVFNFTVSVVEYGLANGTPWTISFLGSSDTQSSRTAFFELPNGSYPFVLEPVAGYQLLTQNGTLTVAGRPVVLEVAFALVPPPPPPPPPPPGPPLLEYILAGAVAAALLAGWALGRRTRGAPDTGDAGETTSAPERGSDEPSAYDAPPP
ncbi:MAG: right-handed parallel beta-helix repeat-containing protein [Thermoplasmata archaeon]|nr:right-handed parallel beta-helix repeat-containing protein [Thermoplasmata archaeon]